ncbi:hypothetical protein GCM10009862_16130 [Microbacterium binotii]|uniref:Uncharacterized protein n=1 Tax=Microbacterium binotii TaxID=462710 RepID=A0ABN3PCE3_9MICO
MRRLLIALGFRIGDPFHWQPTPWTRLRLWARRNLSRKANATCNACGYRGVRTRRGRWCPACYGDENGELILDATRAGGEQG